MEKDFYYVLLNNGIYIEADDMWFVGLYGNELCRGKVSNEECEYKVKIPVGQEGNFSSTPSCIKYQNVIICIPFRGDNIWIYDLEKEKFKKIAINNPQNVMLSIVNYWIVDNTLWAWSGCYGGLESLIEVDLENYKIRDYYRISENNSLMFAWQAALHENCIYLFENSRKELYAFNTVSKKIEKHKISGITGEIMTICCDDENFWLAGEEGCIYTWNIMTEELKQHMNFPEEFQVIKTGKATENRQKWSFYQSVCLNDYVCFIPLDSFEGICNGVLFINKKNYSMKIVKIYDEGINGREGYKLQYVLNGRYVGVYYKANGFISEIDTSDFKIKEKRMKFIMEDYTKLSI